MAKLGVPPSTRRLNSRAGRRHGQGEVPYVNGGPLGGRPPANPARNQALTLRNSFWRHVLRLASQTARRLESSWVANTWVRTLTVSTDYPTGSWWIAALPSGATLLRVHASWGAIGDTDPNVDMNATSQNLIAWGLVTTVGDGSESVPNARTEAADQAPPTQRWIYWETRAFVPYQINMEAGLIQWTSTSGEGPIDTKGQVLATGIPSGDTLNLWASWAMGSGWDPSGSLMFWAGASVLYRDPGS